MSEPSYDVSLTITEGGYRVNRWTGEFEDWHSHRQHDLHPFLQWIVEDRLPDGRPGRLGRVRNPPPDAGYQQ